MKSKTFCVLPWYSQEIKYIDRAPCCLLPKNYEITQIKKELLSGIRTNACQKCWDVEDQGKDSRRIQENKFLDWKLNQGIEKIQEDCYNNKNSTILYQIYLSNLCNQACVTCGSIVSTKWAEIEKRMGITPKLTWGINIDNLEINFKTAQRINLLGGEPMFDARTFHLLEKLLDHGNDQCFISFITNGSVHLNDKQKNLLGSFKKINICVSIDGIESKFEYMRWPGKWKTLLDNLDQYRSLTDNFSVSYTISSINAIYYDETIEWFNNHGLRHNHNLVYSPNWAGFEYMPIVLKQELQQHPFFKNIINITGNEISAAELLQKIQLQDQAKNIKIQDYLPELYQLISSGK